MKNLKAKLSQQVMGAAKEMATAAIRRDANSTSSVIFHQPKAPEALKSFSRR